MRKLVLVTIIGWYFAMAGGTIGPFDNEAKCNELRAWFGTSARTSPCWYYGGGEK